MGVVYEAEDTRLGRHVALKLLSPEACCDPAAMDRFHREARIISSLTHQHICTLYDIGEADGQQFMVMELLEGESLKQRIARGPLPIDHLFDLGVQIADGLDAAHSHAVIHRDIKPANLFITRRGIAKVLDFGVAKLAAGEREPADATRTKAASDVTTAGSAIGTVSYMSPEQARGQEIDARSDLFSFGVVLYEMATGQQPFGGGTSAVIFEGILTRQPVPPSQLNANLTAEFDRVIAKALEKDREIRYQSAADLRADLKRLKRETDTGRAVAATSSVAAVPAPPVAAATQTAPPPSRRALFIGAPLLTVAVVGGVLLWQSQRAPALSSRDTVVLADFTNRTGDAMFDGTLGEALAVQLRQSPFLNLLPEQQVSSTLRLMGRDAMTAVTPELAREICQRTAARATLGGSIASLGSSYVITLRALDCVSGSTLAEQQVQASSKEQVIGALGSAASALRERLGESLSMVQRYDTRVEEATTPSLEALKAYSQGTIVRRTQGDAESQPFFRRAIELDPNFALAHARLGTVLSNLGDRNGAEKATTRAYELRERVSERERLYIEARYHTAVTRDQMKAIEAYRLLIATYPDDYAAHTNVGGLYRNRHMLDEAIASLEQATRVAPDQPLGHTNLAGAYMDAERFADAKREYEAALKLLDATTTRAGLYVTAVYLGDEALAAAQIEAVKGRRDEADMLASRAVIALLHGKNTEAASLSEDRLQRMKLLRSTRLEFSGESFLGVAIGHAMVGRSDLARAELARVRDSKLLADGTSDEMVALGALLGDKQLGDGSLNAALDHLRRVSQPEDLDKGERAMRGFAALSAGRNQEAYDLTSAVGVSDPSQRYTMYCAAIAASRLQRWPDAVRILEALVGFNYRLGTSGLPATARIMLARAYAASGRPADARKAYEDAFRIWKDADADLPLLVEAKKEHAALGS
jgi:tetratricopeptide (TPR) repeat protein/tRNA A-37 threonylcarbamoyl transferase component Bud32